MVRTFESKPAARDRVPLIISLVGPSNSGKTMSALRLATGIQRVTGGTIEFVDTERGRATEYDTLFKFQHVQFEPPFSAVDYGQCVEFIAKRAPGVVVFDSMSHEHEGEGGALEWHTREVERLSKLWKTTPAAANVPAWGEPKKARRKLINAYLQLGVHVIWCFRAKEKIAKRGTEWVDMGWMPIAGEEFMYEATLQCLLPPGCRGVPDWTGERLGETAVRKLPQHLAELFKDPKTQLSEDLGETLAKWAEGNVRKKDSAAVEALVAEVTACETIEELKRIASASTRQGWNPEQRAEIKKAIDERAAALRDKAAADAAAAVDASGPAAAECTCKRAAELLADVGHAKDCAAYTGGKA